MERRQELQNRLLQILYNSQKEDFLGYYHIPKLLSQLEITEPELKNLLMYLKEMDFIELLGMSNVRLRSLGMTQISKERQKNDHIQVKILQFLYDQHVKDPQEEITREKLLEEFQISENLFYMNIFFLRDFGYVELVQYLGEVFHSAQITTKGIDRIEELAKRRIEPVRCFKSGAPCSVELVFEPKKLFVLMPFAPEFNAVYEWGIKAAADILDLECIRSDEIQHNKDAICIICQNIQSSEFVLADLTDRNPNVFYELGLAHGFGREVILITQNRAELPFDLKIMNNIEYQDENNLRHQLEKFLRGLLGLDEENKGLREKLTRLLAYYKSSGIAPNWGQLAEFYEKRKEIPVMEDLCELLISHLASENPAPKAKEWLKEIGEKDHQLLLSVFEERQPKLGFHVVAILESLGVVEPLLEALSDNDVRVRWSAAKALGQIGDPRAVEPLLEALSDENIGIRRSLAEALGHIGDRRAVEPLLEVLSDENVGIRVSAVKALGHIGDRRAVKHLIEVLSDDDVRVRRSTAGALGEIGDQSAVEPLLEILRCDDVRVLGSVAEALGKIGDPRAVKRLLEVLIDENPYIRRRAVGALGKIGDPRVIKPLLEALSDKNPNVRERVAGALGEIGDQSAVEPLLKALSDEDFLVRRSAAGALGAIGNRRAIESLRSVIEDENELPTVRTAAATALDKIKGIENS